jgi:hypothetical protein
MSEKLTESDIAIILESFKYSKKNIRESQDSPYKIKQENLQRIENVEKKLRTMRNEDSDE